MQEPIRTLELELLRGCILPACPAVLACVHRRPFLQVRQSCFRGGGDAWHFGNSSASPYVGADHFAFTHSGNSSAYVYFGSDNTFYTGSSFTRPLFSGDNPITTGSGVSSCAAHDFDATNNVLQVQSNAYFIANGIEWSGFCSHGGDYGQGGHIEFGNGTHSSIQDMYIHGFTYVSGYSYDDFIGINGGGNLYESDITVKCLGNVFDNSDGTYGNTGTYPSGKASLFAIQNTCAEVGYSVFNRVSNAMISPVTSLHDSLFENMYEPQGVQHGNIINSNNDAEITITQYFYNNVFHDINEGVNVWLMPHGGTGYIFNNVSWHISNSVNCYLLGAGTPASPIYFYNNTADAGCQIRGLNNGSDPVFNGTVHFNNNHFIGYSQAAMSSFTVCDSGATCTFTDEGNELFQSEAVANGQGYTISNSYGPTAGGSTIGIGANNTASCPVFSSNSQLCSGTSRGVSEIAGEGGMVASWPAITLDPRLSTGAWDVGAYQYLSTTGSAPAAPSALATTVTPVTP